MPLTFASAPDLRQGMTEAYAVNERMNQVVLEHLDSRAWRAQLPESESDGQAGAKNARTIAAIFAHVHNVRCKWIRLSAPRLKPPPLLNRSRCTQAQAIEVLAKSGALCSRMLAEALASPKRKQAGSHSRSKRRPSCHKIPARRLGPTLASRRGHVRLHDHARSPPPRPGLHAGASARLPATRKSRLRNVDLGKIVEGMRVRGAGVNTLLGIHYRLLIVRPQGCGPKLKLNLSNPVHPF